MVQKFGMKKTLIILVLLFSSSVVAEDISDFEIEGMSIGDSLLDYFSEEVIIKKSVTDYPNSKKFSRFQAPPSKKFEDYDTVDFHYETNDPKYIIVSLSGGIFDENDIEDANQKLENAINTITMTKVDLGRTIDSRIDILKIVDEGKLRIKSISSPQLDFQGYDHIDHNH